MRAWFRLIKLHKALGRFEEATRIRQFIVNVNLRASCETELHDELRSHVVDAWIGHCEEIAKRQDLMVTDDRFAQASEDAVRKPVRYGHESRRTGSQAENEEGRFSAECNEKRPRARTRDRQIWTILDSNQNAEDAGFTGSFDDSDSAVIPNGAKTGAVATPDAELAWLVEVWGSLPDDVRADVVATVKGVATRR